MMPSLPPERGEPITNSSSENPLMMMDTGLASHISNRTNHNPKVTRPTHVNGQKSNVASTFTGTTNHRRKRIRISPMYIPSDIQFTNSRNNHPIQNTPVPREINCLSPVESDESFRCLTPNISHATVAESDAQLQTLLMAHLNGNKIDSEVRSIISKYVRSESVLRCLELAGYVSPLVLECLDETQIQRFEEFIAHSCTLIDSKALREVFVGPVFSQYPDQFRLPSGTVCGLLLATREIKRYRSANEALPSIDIHPSPSTSKPQYHIKSSNVASQTDFSIPAKCIWSQFSTFGDLSKVTNIPTSNNLTNSLQLSGYKSVGTIPLPSNALQDASETQSDTVAMMVAAFKSAAVAAGTTSYHLPGSLPSTVIDSHDNNVNLPEDLINTDNMTISSTNSTPEIIGVTQTAEHPAPVVSICSVATSISQANPHVTNGSRTHSEDELIDLDRLKQHSCASAIRLASRQFLNAHLVRGRDFDMEMEIATTLEGVKRVTGIFYCHLCRERRERTSAVRFSIARNRYPVLSNVLSHLRTHFQYRVQSFSSTHQGNSALHQTTTLSKLPSTLTDSMPVDSRLSVNNSITGTSANQSLLNFDYVNSSMGVETSPSYPDPISSCIVIKGEAIDMLSRSRQRATSLGYSASPDNQRIEVQSSRDNPEATDICMV